MTAAESVRRRRLTLWTSAFCAVALSTGATAAVAAPDDHAPTFDLDTGNSVVELIYPVVQKVERAEVSADGSDVPLVTDYAVSVEVPWFDAIAPYHSTATGIYSNLGRRPRSEATTRNRNIALLYASYRALSDRFPQYAADYRAMMGAAGLDPDDRQENTTTPIGLGNLAARKVREARHHDGLNRYGDEGGRKYNRRPYADYTGYKPVNTAFELRDPSRWQPNLLPLGNGVYRVQQFVTPQMGRTAPLGYDDPSKFQLAPPRNSDHHHRDAYRRQADEILAASAALDDREKATIELFNDKVEALGVVTGTAVVFPGRFDVEKTVQWVTTTDIAIFDTAVASWYFKRKYDSVRPFSAIRYLYGDERVIAWGGPGKGTVHDITGAEWRSYINTADHPEYPSASSALCLAYAQAARRFLGTDKVDITVETKKGSSKIEPGITPAKDITLRWGSWTQYAKDCGMSRLWGGVHFRSSIEHAADFAPQVGDLAYAFVQRKLTGG